MKKLILVLVSMASLGIKADYCIRKKPLFTGKNRIHNQGCFIKDNSVKYCCNSDEVNSLGGYTSRQTYNKVIDSSGNTKGLPACEIYTFPDGAKCHNQVWFKFN